MFKRKLILFFLLTFLFSCSSSKSKTETSEILVDLAMDSNSQNVSSIPSNKVDELPSTNTVVDSVKDSKASISKQIKIKTPKTFLSSKHRGGAYRSWLKYYSGKNRERFQRQIISGEKVRDIVYSVFDQYDLPRDLYYVGLIESGYATHIKSHAGAKGPWQFMKSTAKGYGLIVNSHIDERANIYKATEASAKYLGDLYNIFGNWELALCAYNSGEYRVMNAIRRGNTRNLSKLIEMHLLPKETRNYIPKILAAKDIVENHKAFGFDAKRIKAKKELDEFILKKPTTLTRLSTLTGLSKKAISFMNPDIRSEWISIPKKQEFTLYLPEKYVAKLDSVNDTRKLYSKIQTRRSRSSKASGTPRYHRIRRGDTLINLANRYNLSVSRLLRLNSLRLNSKIFVGQKLVISERKHKARYSRYRVRSGDNLTQISQKFRIPIRVIKRVNKLHRSKIFAGTFLKIPNRI